MPTKTRPSKRKPARSAAAIDRDGWHPQSALANRALPVLANKCAAPPENRAAITDLIGPSAPNRPFLITKRAPARHPKAAR